MTTLESLTKNSIALKELLESIKENRPANKETIIQYEGFGNAREILFNPYDEDQSIWKNKAAIKSKIIEIHELLALHFNQEQKERVISLIQSSALTSFYTPSKIVTAVASQITHYFNQQQKQFSLLEPSSGTGAFIKPLINDPNLLHGTAVEKDYISALIHKKLFEETKITTIRSGFEKYTNQDHELNRKYDLVISNIPFGNYKVFDEQYSKLPKSTTQHQSQNQIHNYFFVKGIDKLEKNGLLVFMSTTSIADSFKSQNLRKHILLNCELLSLTRLPNNTFEDTKVVTDIYILRKRERTLTTLNLISQKEKMFLSSESVTINHSGTDLTQSFNSYFITDGKPNKNIIGELDAGYMHDKKVITVVSNQTLEHISSLLNNNIKSDFSNIRPAIISSPSFQNKPFDKSTDIGQLSLFEIAQVPKQKIQQNFPSITYPKLDIDAIQENYLFEGNLFITNDTLGKIKFSSTGPELRPLQGNYDIEKIKLSTLVLINYKLLINSDPNELNKSKISKFRNNLNAYYDQFVTKYEPFNMNSNRDVVEIDVEGFKLKGLEIYDKKTNKFIKSDIFQENIIGKTNEPIRLADAVLITLNKYNYVNVDHISQLTNLTKDQVVNTGLKDGLFYISPLTDTNHNPTKKYATLPTNKSGYKIVTKDELLSGPVRFKILELEKNQHKWFNNDTINQYYSTLSLLESVKLNELSIEEISPKLGESWIPIQYYTEFSTKLLQTDLSITQNESNSSYIVTSKYFSYEQNRKYSVKCKNGNTLTGDKLLNFALHGQTPIIKYSIKYSKDNIQYFVDREAMSEASMKIEDIHSNWKNYVLNNPDVSETLFNIYNNTQNLNVERTFDGSYLKLDDLQNFELYSHQKNGIHQIITQNGCLIDHIVGSGKTLLFCAATMELKRLNIANKVCITALKANTQEIYLDFIKAYPNAKVLCPTESDFTPQKRQLLFQKMQNNNWDAIILTHEQFQNIPQSREIQKTVLQEEINNLKLDLEESRRHGQQLDKRVIKGLQTRIENKTAKIQSLAASIAKDPFMLTFDKMGIDHLIVDESQEFKNLEFTTRHNRVAGMGSPEGSKRALNMLFAVRTLQEIHKGDKGITFASGTPISNSLIELYLLKKYLVPQELKARNMSNFDSWARSYAELSREFEISITNEIKPKERFRSFQKVPELARFYRSFTNVANDNNIKLDKPRIYTEFVEIASTETQKEYSKQLIDAIKVENFSFFGKELTENQMNAKMLIATTISSKMSLDMRTLDNSLDMSDGTKLYSVAENIYKEYVKSTTFKGTQFVFCDSSTPTSKNAHNFNIYSSLKEYLSYQYGIPENEISFIHDYPTAKKRTELFKKVNAGEIRIIIGSTKKMGTGVNMQEKCVAMHHIDIPWTPKDFEQRDGRGARQGNIAAKEFNNNEVKKYVYATEGTLDPYRYFLVDLKQKFINQIKSSNITSRTIDEGDMDEDGSMSPAAFIARLSGKQELLEKNKVDKIIAELEVKQKVLKSQYSSIKNRITTAKRNLPLVKKRGDEYKKDIDHRNQVFNITDSQIEYKFITNKNHELINPDNIYSAIISELENYNYEPNHKIGQIGNFDFKIGPYEHSSKDDFKDSEKLIRMFLVSRDTGIEYSYGSSILNIESKGMLLRYAYDCLKGLETKVENQIKQAQTYKDELKHDEAEIEKLDVTKFDKLINENKQKSIELGFLIESESSKIEESLVVNRNIISLLEKENSEDTKKLIQNLEPHLKKELNLTELINGLELPTEKKEDLKNQLNEFISPNFNENLQIKNDNKKEGNKGMSL